MKDRNRKAKSDAELVREIVDAWNIPGAYPKHHEQTQRMLRQSWPSLAEPVRELADRAKRATLNEGETIDHAAEARKNLEATERARDEYADMALTPAEVIAMRDRLSEWFKEQFGWDASVRREAADRLIEKGWAVDSPKSVGEK